MVVIEFKIGERIESDHMPLSVKIEEEEGRGEEGRGTRNGGTG